MCTRSGDVCAMRYPISECFFIINHSSSVSFPGLNKIKSGIPILPISWNPYKAIAGAFLFGGLDIIGFRLQGAGIQFPQSLVDMIPYAVTIIILVIVSMNKSKKNASPKNLGVAYFREER